MKETTIALKRIEIQNFSPRSNNATLRISYTHNLTQDSMTKNVILEKPKIMTEEIIKELKQKGKISLAEPDDILGTLFVIHFLNEDKIEEKLFNFLAKLCEKSRYLKHIRDHAEYMKIYDEIKIQKAEF